MNENGLQIRLTLTPEGGDPLADAWQTECAELARTLSSTLAEAGCTVRPERVQLDSAVAGELRSVEATTFSTLLLIALDPSVLSAVVGGVWDLTTTWVRRRPNCRCVLKLPDGSEFQLENLTKEEALALLQAHRAAPGAGTS